jgi:hypothetical protein
VNETIQRWRRLWQSLPRWRTGCLVLALAGLAGCLVLNLAGGALGPGGLAPGGWEEAGFILPDGAGRVVLLRRSTDPLRIEYEQRLSLEPPAREPVVLDLPPQLGQPVPIPVWLHSPAPDGPASLRLLRLELPSGPALIDLDAWRLADAGPAGLSEGRYLGRFAGSAGRLRWEPGSPDYKATPDESGLNRPSRIDPALFCSPQVHLFCSRQARDLAVIAEPDDQDAGHGSAGATGIRLFAPPFGFHG